MMIGDSGSAVAQTQAILRSLKRICEILTYVSRDKAPANIQTASNILNRWWFIMIVSRSIKNPMIEHDAKRIDAKIPSAR